MKKLLLNSLLLLLPLMSLAQRDATQTFSAQKIKSLIIDTDEVYMISLKTTDAETIKISTHSEGEYFNRIALDYTLKNDKLTITSKYPEPLSGGYDKLSAHKVFSLEVRIELPENMDVRLSSNLASVIAEGKYRNLSVDLNEGYCRLKKFTGNAMINTFRGNIEVETQAARIEAESGSGEVKIPENIMGSHIIRLKSVSGDIRVFRNK